MCSIATGEVEDDEKYLYNKQLKIALFRAIGMLRLNERRVDRLQNLQHLLRRPADARLAAFHHDRAFDQFRVRRHRRQQLFFAQAVVRQLQFLVQVFFLRIRSRADVKPSSFNSFFSSSADGGVSRYSTTLGSTPCCSSSAGFTALGAARVVVNRDVFHGVHSLLHQLRWYWRKRCCSWRSWSMRAS